MAGKMKLRTKLYSGYAVVLMFIVAISIFVYINVNSILQSVYWVNHTYTVLHEVQVIEKAIVDMETGQRGFIIAGKEEFLDPFKNGQKIVKVTLDNVRKLTSDNPKQVERFNKIESAINEWYKKAANVEIQARRDMNQGKLTFNEVSALIIKATGKNIMDSMRVVLDEVKAEENRLIGPRKQDQQDSATLTYYMLFFASLLAVIIGIVTGYFIIRGVSRELGGEPSDVVNVSNRLAQGDFTVEINLKDNDDSSALASMNKMRKDLEGLISNIILSAQNLAQAVQEISSGNENLSQRTSEQASSLEEVASTIEETSATINQNAENSENANKKADSASIMAENGGTLIQDAVLSINEINETSKKIGEIISVINEIAFQTNLLALNAAVEAARAGEQGRGFAVVAGEVRNLAQRSGNAAKDIGDLIKNSLEKIGDGTDKANKSGEAIQEIITSFKEVGQVVSEIAAASIEQRQGIQQINVAVTELDTMTQQNASLVEETASASEEMSNQAQELLGLMNKFEIRKQSTSNANKSKRNEIHLQTTANKSVKKFDQRSLETQAVSEKVDKPADRNGNEMKKLMQNEGFEEF